MMEQQLGCRQSHRYNVADIILHLTLHSKVGTVAVAGTLIGSAAFVHCCCNVFVSAHGTGQKGDIAKCQIWSNNTVVTTEGDAIKVKFMVLMEVSMLSTLVALS